MSNGFLRSHKDDYRKKAGLYSNNSSGTLRSQPKKIGARLIVVTRTGPRPQMLWKTFPFLPRAAAFLELGIVERSSH